MIGPRGARVSLEPEPVWRGDDPRWGLHRPTCRQSPLHAMNSDLSKPRPQSALAQADELRQRAEEIALRQAAATAAAQAGMSPEDARRILHELRVSQAQMELLLDEMRQTQAALRESEVRYQRITEAITDYIYSVRVVNGRAVNAVHGPGCLAVTGYRDDEFASNPLLWRRIVVDEDRPAVDEQTRRMLAGDKPPPLEHRIVRKNAMERWVKNTFVPRYDGRGRLVAYDGLIRDITVRKHAEEVLRQKYAELERFNKVTVGREIRMIELKQEINALLKAAGQPAKYRIVDDLE